MGLYRIEELLNFWSPGIRVLPRDHYTIVLAVVETLDYSNMTSHAFARVTDLQLPPATTRKTQR